MGNRELLPTSVPAVMGVVLILLQENQWEGDRDPSLGKSERSDRERDPSPGKSETKHCFKWEVWLPAIQY